MKPENESFAPYRAVSRAAVASFVFALISVVIFAGPTLAFFPLLGIGLAFLAFSNLRRYPEELTGRGLAWAGMAGSILLLVGGTGFHIYVYLTEVPEGYQRVSFSQLQPDRGSPMPVSNEALELNGQRIFIKGYTYPGEQLHNIKQFILVPDLGTCCFGGQPPPTHMIEVTLQDPHRISYAQRLRKFGGILKVDTRPKHVGEKLGEVYYQLDVDYVK